MKDCNEINYLLIIFDNSCCIVKKTKTKQICLLCYLQARLDFEHVCEGRNHEMSEYLELYLFRSEGGRDL